MAKFRVTVDFFVTADNEEDATAQVISVIASSGLDYTTDSIEELESE